MISEARELNNLQIQISVYTSSTSCRQEKKSRFCIFSSFDYRTWDTMCTSDILSKVLPMKRTKLPIKYANISVQAEQLSSLSSTIRLKESTPAQSRTRGARYKVPTTVYCTTSQKCSNRRMINVLLNVRNGGPQFPQRAVECKIPYK